MKDTKNGYLSEDELMELISETEQDGIMKAPEYLETKVRSRISAEKKHSFVLYSIKIMAAAAAAIILIVFMPEVVAKPQRESLHVLEGINSRTSAICETINDTTEKMIIKEDR